MTNKFLPSMTADTATQTHKGNVNNGPIGAYYRESDCSSSVGLVFFHENKSFISKGLAMSAMIISGQ